MHGQGMCTCTVQRNICAELIQLHQDLLVGYWGKIPHQKIHRLLDDKNIQAQNNEHTSLMSINTFVYACHDIQIRAYTC